MKYIAISVIALVAGLLQPLSHSQTLPDPFQDPIEHWGQFPDGRQWGATIGLSPDSKGHMWALERCGGTKCTGAAVTVNPIVEIDIASGKVIKSFGAGLFVVPHNIFVDQNDHDNLWVTDQSAEGDKGEQVWKFSPEGKVLMTLGVAGKTGDTPTTFNDPTEVVTGKNGDIFVADGHASRTQTTVSRIMKFSKDGKLIKIISHMGSGPGELHDPHSITMDSQGRLFVADRENYRISIFDQDGNFIDTWKQFGIPTGIYIDKKTDTLYVAENYLRAAVPDAVRGVRIGSAKTGVVTGQIIDPNQDPKKGSIGPDAPSADKFGNLYIGENDRMEIKKFVPKK